MSDRRPSKLYVWEAPYPLNVATDANEFVESNFIREASPTDLLAAVRRGVESGQIEGWFKRWCVKHDCEGLGNADRGEIGCTGAGAGRAVDMDCRLVPVLIAEVGGL